MNPADLGYAAGWKLVRGMPEPVARGLFKAAADYAHRKNGRGTQRLRANLRRVVGPDMPDNELDALVRANLRSYARYWREAFRLPSRTHQQHLDDFQVDNWQLLAKLLEDGGVIMALNHSGNWDVAGAWVTANGWKLTTVAERLKPESVYERFVEYRRSMGFEIIPLTGGEQPPFDLLVQRLREGATVPLLADRDLSKRGVEVEFFGGRTRMPSGPALLAIRTGAPLLVIDVWYDEKSTRGYINPPIEIPGPETGTLRERVAVITQRMASAFEATIARHPQDWHMLQRVWLDEPPTPEV
ncbi:phosphatidylinositol mannoside acyltransferase [Asanoa ishikariensis]|uniref:KDO2-lipid IV(A) lauroyltransferase n=1 Tax=Asanoa ishikariensis TaxID=137265 RepID=A0A1H3S9X7_9ACTN|nr:phosphatidylinositol mannoside acyltransferase [Asanoa ishikariensis]GIF70246.1 phosphatidylinositol mannoside acyltransferase [Asanoa ishikariensis]SDZ34802.1 KDO2-lipid IV(A) lauroyltransferase [Asanoa ishikariensis]